MRYLKKLIAPIICIIFVLFIYNAVSVSVFATEGEAATQPTEVVETENDTKNKSYIDVDIKNWKNFEQVYVYIWDVGRGHFFEWGSSEDAECEHIQDSVWRYDLSKLKKSEYIKGGIKKGRDYCVIFYTDTGMQTYDLTMGIECTGDTAVLTGKMIENPIDADKQGYEVVWSENSEKFGPHLSITSIGNFVGSNLAPNENPICLIGDWLINYPSTSMHCNPEEIVAKALKKFKIKDIDAIYAYILSYEDFGLADMDIIKSYLMKAYILAYPDGNEGADKPINGSTNEEHLIAENGAKYELKKGKELIFTVNTIKTTKFTSTDKKVATITKDGILKTKALGVTVITCKYGKKTIKMTVYVNDAGYKEYYAGKKVDFTSIFKTIKDYKSGKWSSSNSKIVSVKAGKIDCKKHGNAIISLKVGNRKYSIKVYSYSKGKLKEESVKWLREYGHNPQSIKVKKSKYNKKFKVKVKFTYLNRKPEMKRGVFVGYYIKGKFDGYLV